MASLPMRVVDLFVGEAVAGRLGSVSDVLDGVESIPDVLGRGATVCVVLLVVVAATTSITLMIEIVFGPISSLTNVV